MRARIRKADQRTVIDQQFGDPVLVHVQHEKGEFGLEVLLQAKGQKTIQRIHAAFLGDLRNRAVFQVLVLVQ